MKHSSVWIKPYDRWNRVNNKVDTIAFVLLIVTIFYHPFWLAVINGLFCTFAGTEFIVILWLNEHKKKQLAKSERQHTRK